MTADARKYVRVYYSIRSDERFSDVYADDRRLATWLRLLLDADAVWPEPASIPVTANRAAFRDLVACGLIEAAPNGCFRIHGLERERTTRTDAARNAAALRWQEPRNAEVMRPHDKGNAVRNAEVMPIKSKHIQADPSPTREALPTDGEATGEEAALNAYQAVGGSVRSERAVAWLYRLVSEHGADPVIRLIGKLAPSVRIEKLIGEVEGALVRGRVESAKAEDEDQAGRARTNREAKAARKLAYLRGEITEAEYDSGMKT